MIIANRSVDRAQELAAEFHGFAIGLDDIATHLHGSRHRDRLDRQPDADHHVRRRDATALRARKRKPIFMVDIAVPRDIEPTSPKLEDVYLFTIDDLQYVVNENLEGRRASGARRRPS